MAHDGTFTPLGMIVGALWWGACHGVHMWRDDNAKRRLRLEVGSIDPPPEGLADFPCDLGEAYSAREPSAF